VTAVIPVRHGRLPLGAGETVMEAGGDVLLVGGGAREALGDLKMDLTRVRLAEAGPFQPGTWAAGLAPILADADVVVLPASPDGRDLAPRLAAALDRPLWAGAVSVSPECVQVARQGGRVLLKVRLEGPVVATLLPGIAGVDEPERPLALPEPEIVAVGLPPVRDAEVLEELAADPQSMDLTESPRIFSGGAGLGSAEAFDLVARVAAAVGASMGATRVACDLGWASFARQIGTTGVTVDPRLYVAFGVSGGVQHLAGIGNPEHVISVNIDPSCPMMARANLAVVADAPATLTALAQLLGVAWEVPVA
jgi:electron transfer flavoprotein alpha subunit